MDTPIVITTPPLAVVLSPLLLTENCSGACLPDPGNVTPEMLKLRVTQVTVVLREILEQKGFHHGGINE